MYELVSPSRTVAKEWTELIQHTADEYKRVNPKWEEALLRKLEESRAQAEQVRPRLPVGLCGRYWACVPGIMLF